MVKIVKSYDPEDILIKAGKTTYVQGKEGVEVDM